MNNTILKKELKTSQTIPSLSLVGTSTMGDDLKRWWANVRAKKILLKIDVNNRAEESDLMFGLKTLILKCNKVRCWAL
jgi:hypothetical protein